MNAISIGGTNDRQLTLRRALFVDAIVSGSLGAVMALTAGPLHDVLGLSPLLLRVIGLILLPYAGLLIYAATRPRIPRRIAGVVVGMNLLWAVDSITLLFTGWIDPSTVGAIFIVGQALIVAAFADLQYLGLRRSR